MQEDETLERVKPTLLNTRVVAWIGKTFGVASALSLLILMIIVTVDVIGRYVFSSPLRGSFEYIQIGMALVVFLALPVVVARENNVEVEVFHNLLPKRIRRPARTLGSLVSIVVVGVLTYVSFLRADSFHASGERFILLPAKLYPVAYFIFAMWAVCIAIMLFQFVRFLSGPRASETRP